MSPRSVLSLCLVCLVLVACTPSHTLQTAESYSRELGLTNRYDIQRWHNRRLPADSRILVSAVDGGGLEAGSVTAAVADALSAYFGRVEALPVAASTAAARREASKRQSQFLFAIEKVQWREAARLGGRNSPSESEPESQADDADQQNADQPDKAPEEPQRKPEENISGVLMSVAIIDVVSGNIVDKVVIDATAAGLGSAGGELPAVIEKPLQQLGRDLTGL